VPSLSSGATAASPQGGDYHGPLVVQRESTRLQLCRIPPPDFFGGKRELKFPWVRIERQRQE